MLPHFYNYLSHIEWFLYIFCTLWIYLCHNLAICSCGSDMVKGTTNATQTNRRRPAGQALATTWRLEMNEYIQKIYTNELKMKFAT